VIALLVALGAAVGAPARYLTDRAVQSRVAGRGPSRMPFGTLSVNVVASLVLGLLAGLGTHVGHHMSALIGTGFCGALSTYSTFGFETMRLSGDGRARVAVEYVLASLVLGLGAAALGWWLGATLC
jgi:CrcB protein